MSKQHQKLRPALGLQRLLSLLHPRPATKLLLIVLFGLAVGGFWYIEATTPARIGSLALFVLVSSYALVTHRTDVIASCTYFFITYDVNRYLFENILPIWLGLVAAIIALAIIWLILFRREGWLLAIAIAILVAEMTIAMQFAQIEMKLQSLVTVLPFLMVCQYYYFQVFESEEPALA